MFNGNRGFSAGVKRPARETDHSLSPVVNVKNERNCTPTYKKYFPFSFPFYEKITPWRRILFEKDSSSASQEICRNLLSPRGVITGFTKARHLPLSWGRPICFSSPSYFLKVHSNITLVSTHRCCEWLIGFPHQNPVCTSLFPQNTPYAAPTAFVFYENINKYRTYAKVLWTAVAYQGGAAGVFKLPPPEIPKAFHNRAKLNPIVKTVKIAEFKTPTNQDIRKKGSKILTLPRFAIVLH